MKTALTTARLVFRSDRHSVATVNAVMHHWFDAAHRSTRNKEKVQHVPGSGVHTHIHTHTQHKHTHTHTHTHITDSQY